MNGFVLHCKLGVCSYIFTLKCPSSLLCSQLEVLVLWQMAFCDSRDVITILSCKCFTFDVVFVYRRALMQISRSLAHIVCFVCFAPVFCSTSLFFVTPRGVGPMALSAMASHKFDHNYTP